MPHPRTSASALRRLLDDGSVVVYALDPDRRLVYFNQALADWLGEAAEALLGVQCNYHASAARSGPAGVAAGLCPPPDAMQGEPRRGWVEHDGRRRAAWFVPLPPGPGAAATAGSAGVLVFVGLAAAPPAEAAEASEAAPRDAMQQAWRELRQVYSLENLAGRSPAMQRARRQVRLAAGDPTCNVLVVGEPGSGREQVARTIHTHRNAPAARLLPLSCPLLDAELLESSLPAGEPSADWTAAPRPTTTLLLLDVDQLPGDAQKVLASHLQRNPETPLLGTSRMDLQELAAEERMRDDLAAVLGTLLIRLPELQQRLEDLPVLCQLMLEQRNASGGRQFSGLQPAALDLLTVFPWRRGLDELREVLEAACRNAGGGWIQVDHLPHQVRLADLSWRHPAREPEPIELERELERQERRLIREALENAKGNKAQAARLLSISRTRLLRRMEQLDVAWPPPPDASP